MFIGITLERPIRNVDRKVSVIFFNPDHFRQLGEIHTSLLLLYTYKYKTATSSKQQRATFYWCSTFFLKMLPVVVQCFSMFLRVPVAGNLLLIASFHWKRSKNKYGQMAATHTERNRLVFDVCLLLETNVVLKSEQN